MGEGWVNPKVYIKKCLYTGKRVFKMDFFNTRTSFGKFWEQHKKFWENNIFFWNFGQKVYISRGGGSQRQSGKVNIIFLPFPLVFDTMLLSTHVQRVGFSLMRDLKTEESANYLRCLELSEGLLAGLHLLTCHPPCSPCRRRPAQRPSCPEAGRAGGNPALESAPELPQWWR